MDLKMQNAKESLAFIFIFLFGAALYLFSINFSDLWIDETFTKRVIEFPFAKMVELLKGDFHPPLYFILLKLFTSVFGITIFTIRLFSVLGVLCTLMISYIVGGRLFGRSGALYFCLLILSIPMLVTHSHDARMYTWASFSVTAVFLYSSLFIKENKRKDLIFLGFFTLMAAYLHYYSLIAVFCSNLFVFIYLLVKKNRTWTRHLVTMSIVVVLYVPWLVAFLAQTNAAKNEFWIPPVTFKTVLSCYLDPFAQKFWLTISSWVLILLVYSLIFFSIYKIYKRKKEDRYILGLSLIIYNATILAGLIISFLLRPMLISRYMAVVVTMLVVPLTLYFINMKNTVVKWILLLFILCCGVFTALPGSRFSMGPYKQSMEHLKNNHPEIKKVLHITEVTAGPLLDHNKIGHWQHYWINNQYAIEYTNLSVFTDLHKKATLDEFLTPGEIFCMADVKNSPLNRENFDLVLSKSRLIRLDEILDQKSKGSMILLLYILEY